MYGTVGKVCQVLAVLGSVGGYWPSSANILHDLLALHRAHPTTAAAPSSTDTLTAAQVSSADHPNTLPLPLTMESKSSTILVTNDFIIRCKSFIRHSCL